MHNKRTYSEEELKIINDKNVNLDRLLYNKNTIPALFTYLGIIFDVVYFVIIYKTNNVYFYKTSVFASVLINLLFLLFGFLSSEGIKNYKKVYSYILLFLGAIQIVRIFIYPLGAYNTPIMNGEEVIGTVFTFKNLFTTALFLALSSFSMVFSGLFGLYKINTLEKYKKSIGK